MFALTAGDIAIVAVNTDATRTLTFVTLTSIPANTTISFTDNAWDATNQTWRTGEGTIAWTNTVTTNAGTVITLSLGTTYSSNVGSITTNTNFALSTSGDQILAYEGSTAPTTNSSNLWLYAFSNENFVYGNNTNTSDVPTSLSGASVGITTSTTEKDNAYFANGNTAQTSVSISGTKSELLALFNDASKYYSNDTGPLTIPTYSITVNTGSTPAATPTFTPAAGTYTSAQSVTLSSSTSGALIYYTTNGVDPTSASTPYTGAINIASTTTLKAIAYDSSNANPSSVATALYTINIATAAETPTFSPAAGTYSSAQSVTLSSATSGAHIYYTTDGSEPSSASTEFNTITPINVATTTTLKAIAYDSSNANPSSVASATYTIAVPTITVTETSIPAMTAIVGETDSETINVSGTNLTENIAIAITGTNSAMFSVNPTSITQTGGTASNTSVVITYTPTAAGSHTATLELTSAGAATVTRTLTGTATFTPLSTPVATAATSVGQTSFTANWETVTGATSYQLNVYTQGGTSTTTVLSENFDGFSAGTLAAPNSTDISATLDTYTQTTGWTGVKVYQAAGTAKMGSSSALGSITTPSLDLTGSNVSLSFKSMGWNADATTINVKLDGVSIATPTIVSDQTTWTTITLPISSGTATSKITFEGAQAAKGRFFIEDLLITKGGVSTTPVSGSPFTVSAPATSYSVTGLTTGTTYYYDLTASNTNVTTSLSNTINVTTGTGGTGLNNNKIENISATNGKVRFDAIAGESVEIYNSIGQKLINKTAVEGQNTIDLPSVKGIIIVKVGNKTAKVVL